VWWNGCADGKGIFLTHVLFTVVPGRLLLGLVEAKANDRLSRCTIFSLRKKDVMGTVTVVKPILPLQLQVLTMLPVQVYALTVKVLKRKLSFFSFFYCCFIHYT